MKYIKIVGYGILVWLIPFVVSFLFYRNGQLSISIFTFKTIMLLIGTSFGVFFLFLVLHKEKPNIHFAFAVGLLWFVINVFLDFITVVPMGHITITTYFTSIGLRYLLMPVIALGMGTIQKSSKEH